MLPLLSDPPRVFVRAADAPQPIARGLPASPGVATGVIATSSADAERAADSGQSVILVRTETSPEDVRGMSRSAGVLTARGGLASHAAVVARGWGIPAVVGAESLSVNDGWIEIEGKRLPAGQSITIDGSSGEVFDSEIAGELVVAPEAEPLLDWARELGIDVAATDALQSPADAPAAPTVRTNQMPDPQPTADDVARVLLVKGSVTDDQLADSLAAPSDRVGTLVDGLIQTGTCERAAGHVRLTGAGKLQAAELIAAERADASLDDGRAAELLDEFHALDSRMKEIVTGWQMRDVAGEQVLNDHTDPAYDAQLLEDMAALHADASGWLEPLSRRVAAVRRLQVSPGARARTRARGRPAICGLATRRQLSQRVVRTSRAPDPARWPEPVGGSGRRARITVRSACPNEAIQRATERAFLSGRYALSR